MPEALRLLVLEPRPFAEHLRKRRLAVERVDPAENLLVADLLRLGDVDEDVEVVRHDRIRKNDHAAPRLVAPPGCCAGGYELLDPAQQRNRASLLVVIEKECLMCQSADQVVAPAILYKSRFPHAKQYIINRMTVSMKLYQ